MIIMWAKIIKEDKIATQYTYQSIDNFTEDTFYLHISNICHKLDLPTPVILPMHIKHFAQYGSTYFKPRDFVESVNLDRLVIENIRKN